MGHNPYWFNGISTRDDYSKTLITMLLRMFMKLESQTFLVLKTNVRVTRRFRSHNAWIKGSKEIAGLMLMTIELEIQQNLEPLHAHQMIWELETLFAQQAEQENYNMHSMRKTVNELHAMLKLHEQTLPKSNALALNAIRAGKVQKDNKQKKSQSQIAAKGQNRRKGENKQAYAPKPKIPPSPKREDPAKDSISHEYGEIGHWKRNCPQYLAELLKKKKNAASGAGGSGIFGLRACTKLKPGVLSFYVGNGQREAVEAIGAFYLCLPSGLEIVLNNCHYAPSITRGVISVFRLYEDGFVNLFVDNTIQVSRNKVIYFSVIPTDGIFEIDLSNSLTNESSIYDHKHEVFETFKVFQKEVENRLGKTIKSLRSDSGGEYMSQEFLDHLKDHEITAHRTPPYTPQHNGVSERRNRTLLDMVRSMMSQTTLPKSFWDYALETDARILNMVPTKKVEKTPYEVWHGKAPKLSYLKVWGCKETMGYSFYYPPENKVLVARNAEFLENSLINQEASGSLEDLEIIQEEDTHPSIDTSLNHKEDNLEIDEPQSDIVPIHRPTRTRHDPNHPESKKWLNAMNVEMQSMNDNEVWVLVELPPNGKTIGSKWLFKKKTDMDRNVHIYKARLVAKGYTQTPRIDYEETFSSVADIRAIRILIAIAAYYDYEIWQMNNLGDIHWTTVKNILKYLRNTKDMFIVYGVSGYVFVLNGGAVGWKSAKQSIFATSSAEAEYIAAFDASKEVVWVRKFISGLGVVPTIEEPISMYCDNTGEIAIANESGITKGARHFRAKVHYRREVIEYGDIKLEKAHTHDNLADPFAKALTFSKHSEHTRNIGMLPASSLIRERKGADLDPDVEEDEPWPTFEGEGKKNKDTKSQVEVKKRARNLWTDEKELLLAECVIQIFEDPKTGCDQQKDTFWYKILDVYNTECKKRKFVERTKNMLAGKWTPINAAVQNFNQLVTETLVHSGENDEDWMTRVQILYRFRVTDEDSEHFRDDVLPRPPGLQRLGKSQRSGSNSTASSSSNPIAYQEFVAKQYELDRKAKMQVIEHESEDQRRLIRSQRIAEDMKVLQIDTRGMDPTNAAIINAQKARIRSACLPPTN
nr:hypothetical protein [Tanacetum cinerariifolium]